MLTLVIDGKQELLEIDAEQGPKVYTASGGTTFFELKNLNLSISAMRLPQKTWKDYTSTERTVLAHMAAKKNQSMRSWAAPLETPEMILARQAELQAIQEAAVRQLALRCEAERARAPISWKPMSLEQVSAKHAQRSAGVFYGLEFPWTSQMLVEFGPAWLTEAFQRAGTLEEGNRVTHIAIDDIKVTAGNNAGKFLFEVRYEKERADLHRKLFAKVPFALTKETKSDRLSSSVLKQPMDFYEINTYRVAETSLPMKTPKFYFGDISNETSNYILITERVPFVEMDGTKRSRQLQPFEVEGPYDKCKDFELRGDAKEYYTLIMQASAKIGAADKSGRMGSQKFLASSFGSQPTGPDKAEAYGVNPQAASGGPPVACLGKLKIAIQFFSETAAAVFPRYVTHEQFISKFTTTMMTLSAYSREIEFWKHQNLDYVALGHANLNVDNAYFWRDEAGTLDCGVLDWGGFGASCLGHKIWWYLNCAEFDQLKSNMNHYISTFIATYHECGGPLLDSDVVEMMVKLTCLSNLMFMVAAVPDCLRQCQQKEWGTVKDRHDPRISENVGGKSTLRTTLRVMDNGLRMIEEMQADLVLDRWIKDVWVGQHGQMVKTDAIIFGGLSQAS
ncbi:unnamed protein product [Polarella glacialis]|uniref:Uncharacterized protein n=1 Tax=Polarella glacialis TaxID=89957 RepID=A0A813KW27_POLGL|nr:unnamed protein product [Polarella glacialis]